MCQSRTVPVLQKAFLVCFGLQMWKKKGKPRDSAPLLCTTIRRYPMSMVNKLQRPESNSSQLKDICRMPFKVQRTHSEQQLALRKKLHCLRQRLMQHSRRNRTKTGTQTRASQLPASFSISCIKGLQCSKLESNSIARQPGCVPLTPLPPGAGFCPSPQGGRNDPNGSICILPHSGSHPSQRRGTAGGLHLAETLPKWPSKIIQNHPPKKSSERS